MKEYKPANWCTVTHTGKNILCDKPGPISTSSQPQHHGVRKGLITLKGYVGGTDHPRDICGNPTVMSEWDSKQGRSRGTDQNCEKGTLNTIQQEKLRWRNGTQKCTIKYQYNKKDCNENGTQKAQQAHNTARKLAIVLQSSKKLAIGKLAIKLQRNQSKTKTNISNKIPEQHKGEQNKMCAMKTAK